MNKAVALVDKGTGEVLADDVMAVVNQWTAAKETLKVVQEAEMKLRKMLLAGALPPGAWGTHHLPLVDQLAIKFTIPKEYKISDETALDKLTDEFAKNEWMGRFADDLLKWKPSIVAKEFDKCREAAQTDARWLAAFKKLEDVVVIKPGSPQIEVYQVKEQ